MILGGLALAFSRLIDNSVVVLENIFRHLEMGESPEVAAEKGGAEVALPVLAATFATVVVFFPVTFLYGVSQYLFTALALSVVLSLFASYVVAMTVVPVFCANFIKGHGGHGDSHPPEDGYDSAGPDGTPVYDDESGPRAAPENAVHSPGRGDRLQPTAPAVGMSGTVPSPGGGDRLQPTAPAVGMSGTVPSPGGGDRLQPTAPAVGMSGAVPSPGGGDRLQPTAPAVGMSGAVPSPGGGDRLQPTAPAALRCRRALPASGARCAEAVWWACCIYV